MLEQFPSVSSNQTTLRVTSVRVFEAMITGGGRVFIKVPKFLNNSEFFRIKCVANLTFCSSIVTFLSSPHMITLFFSPYGSLRFVT